MYTNIKKLHINCKRQKQFDLCVVLCTSTCVKYHEQCMVLHMFIDFDYIINARKKEKKTVHILLAVYAANSCFVTVFDYTYLFLSPYRLTRHRLFACL